MTGPVRGNAHHWNDRYSAGDSSLGWTQPHATMSLRLIEQYGTGLPAWPERSVIDIGAGASVFVDDVLDRGGRDITALDIADAGMALTRVRLGDLAVSVTWLVADMVAWEPRRTWDVWHDRAVLHFLTEDADRDRYRDHLLAGTAPGSLVVIGGFGPASPDTCSRLPVRRATPAEMTSWLGADFRVVDTRLDLFVTPHGDERQYVWTTAIRR